jgi:predicted kinase
MISLIQLLNEDTGKPKAIIMAGGASVGKSTFLNSYKQELKGFENLNADKYVEDKSSPLYNNVMGSSSKIKNEDLPNAIRNKSNLIYDTTASNIKTLIPTLQLLLENGYDIMMVMVYAHPMVSFLRNYKRERKVPAVGILGTWVNVYNLIEDYRRIFKNNFILVNNDPITEEEKREVKNFQTALETNNLQKYFDNLLSDDTFKSTFRKDDSTVSPLELDKLNKSREKSKEVLSKSIEKLSTIYNDVQSHINPTDKNEITSILKRFTNE